MAALFVSAPAGWACGAARTARGAQAAPLRTAAARRTIVMSLNRKRLQARTEKKTHVVAPPQTGPHAATLAEKAPLYFMFVMAGVQLTKRILAAPGALPHEKILIASLLFALPGAAVFCASKMDESLEMEGARNAFRITKAEIENQQNRSALCAAASLAGFFSAAWISPALGAALVTGAQLFFHTRTKFTLKNRVVTRVDQSDEMKRTGMLSSFAALMSNVSPLAVAFSVLFLTISVFNGSILTHMRLVA
ncbi:hypothetical protein FVE85_1028 [Porphyridium purpureum]|uniref:Uncharacterized protein n=1 Tax=Porphyridium purpureum TaxID=35688 RepID=A0A5J4Z0A9_PORPP|nr:hypothetical protein FVE85_1028 [Porphyridium purpureum]|eukprot:POR6669..scf208_2